MTGASDRTSNGAEYATVSDGNALGPSEAQLDSPSGAQKETRQGRVRQRETRIIAAARQIFLARGFSGATMAMIAREAGVADGTLYTYFENKDALARAVITDFYERLTVTAQDGVDGKDTARAKLEWLARHHLSHVLNERGIIEMLPLLVPEPHAYEGSALYEMNRRYVGVFDRIVRDAQRTGDIAPERTPWVLRDIFFGSLDYGAKTMSFKAAKKPKSEFVTNLVNMICGATAPAIHPDLAQPDLAARLDLAVTRMENLLKDSS